MIEWIFFPILGLISGSFTNVLILREERGESIGGRSHCVSCLRTLSWYELVPLISFVVLRGKCRTCHTQISLQYPLVEALTAALVTVVGLAALSNLLTLISLGIVVLLVAIAVFDLRTMYIPDRWVYALAALSFLYGFLYFAIDASGAFWFVISGPLTALPLAILWGISRGAWMGFGDVKLAVSFGWLLGLLPGFLALGIAFVLGAIVGLFLIGITRLGSAQEGFTMRSEVPFGPFLILAACIVWFSNIYGFDLLSALTEFLVLV